MRFSLLILLLYAVPFALLSLLAFGFCAALSKLRRHALSALAAPAAFGFCALVGYLGSLLVSRLLFKGQLGPVEALTAYLLLGLLGAWLAVFLVELTLRKKRS